MADVSGSIYTLDRKRGPVWYMKFRPPSGRQVQRKIGPVLTERSRPPAGYFTRKTAKAELEEVLTDVRRGAVPDPGDSSGKTFGDAVAEWLRYVEDDKARRPSTVRDYRNTADGTLLPEFGSETPLDAITGERIEAYRARLLSGGEVSRRTAQKHLGFLHAILKRAKALKWVRENAAEEVEKVNLPRTSEFNVLSTPQVFAVAREAEPLFAAAIIVAAYTGLRTGELRALQWGDIDFVGTTIRVHRNMPVGGELGTPKSGKARSVPLTDDAAKELDQLSRRERFTGAGDRVFVNEVGSGLGEDTLRKALYAAMAAADIDRKAFPAGGGFTFHCLRHTFGTMAVQVWPLHDVQA